MNKTGCQVLAWLHRLRNEGGNAFNELKNWNEAKLRRTLDWIQKNVPARDRKANLTAEDSLGSRVPGRIMEARWRVLPSEARNSSSNATLTIVTDLRHSLDC